MQSKCDSLSNNEIFAVKILSNNTNIISKCQKRQLRNIIKHHFQIMNVLVNNRLKSFRRTAVCRTASACAYSRSKTLTFRHFFSILHQQQQKVGTSRQLQSRTRRGEMKRERRPWFQSAES